MEMHQIRYFLAVCDALNFTRAAEHCNVSQPSLTRAIQALEDELGGQLFRRERNNTHLTGLGEMMRPHLANVLAETEAAKLRAKSFKKLEDVELKVGVMCTIAPNRLVGFFSAFQQRYPRIRLSVRENGALAVQKQLDEEAVDVAMYGLPDPLEERFQGRRLYDERFVIVFPPGHPFEKLNAVGCKDLHEQKYISRAGCEVGSFMRDTLRELDVKVQTRYVSDRDDWVQSMILAGGGFGFFPEFSVTMPGLCTRPLVDPEVRRQVDMVTVRGRPHTPAVAAFLREATRHHWTAVG
jgi:LysR family hydrogen peroxide-inducible transcriptional activator